MPIQSKFYNIFWNNSQCQEIFLLHKEQLLEKGELKLTATTSKSYYLPRIVLSNTQKRKETLQRIEQRLQNRNIEADHTLNIIGTKNIDEDKVANYFKEKFGKSIDLISKKINGNNFTQYRFVWDVVTALASERKLLSFLCEYNFVPKSVSTFTELKKYTEDFFDKELSSVLNSGHLIDMFDSIDQVANYYNNYVFKTLIAANKFYTDILYDKENFKDRIDLFDSLYEATALIGGHYKTYYECVNCDIGTFSGNMTLKVVPSKVKLKCPNCNKDVFYLAPYKIHDSIYNDITSQDGLIFSAVKQLFDSHKITYASNVTTGHDIEIDFQIVNKDKIITGIVETKMYKTDRPSEVILTNLKEGLRKLLNARNKLLVIDGGYVHVDFHYLTNVTDEQLLRAAYDSFRGEIGNARVFIHNTSSFKNFASELSQHYK
jgi:hypothetical protein